MFDGKQRSSNLHPCILLVLCVALAHLPGCSGGGGGGGGAPVATAVVATSFVGSPPAPGGTPPRQFRDELLLIRFGGPIDNLIFGGFQVDPATGDAVVAEGLVDGGASAVLYHPYAVQNVARAALQVFNDTTGQLHPSGIVGRSVTDARTLVYDPRVLGGNPFGLPASRGFDPLAQYDVFVPAASGITIGGEPADPFGTLPPVAPPPFASEPTPSPVFFTQVELVPDNSPPHVVEIVSLALEASGGDPATTPIPHDDTLRVRFSEPIDPASIDLTENVVIRNTTVTTPTAPDGVLVPVAWSVGPSGTELLATPQPSFGPMASRIEVVVGGNALPRTAILDLPVGAAGSQNALAETAMETFMTVAAPPGTPQAFSEVERFTDSSRQDGTFDGRFNDAAWNLVPPGGTDASGQLRGIELDGSPLPGAGLGSGPGARTQVSIQPLGVPLAGDPPVVPYFSPFDDDGVNNFGGGVNPMGGSHLQLMYTRESGELPDDLADTIELIEWSPSAGLVSPLALPGFEMKMGHTTNGIVNTVDSPMSFVFDANFDFDNPQNELLMPAAHPDPTNMNANEAPITVVPMQTYMLGEFILAGSFIPFPLLSLPFDFDANRLEVNGFGIQRQPNLVVDIDIPPPVPVSNNFCIGTNEIGLAPTRRIAAASGAPVAFIGDRAAYHARFTFVKKNGSARTIFLDNGGAAAGLIDFVSLDVFPTPGLTPAASVTVRMEGADQIMSGDPVNSTGLLTIFTRDGVFDATALDALDGRRFYRVLFELESLPSENITAFVESFRVGLAQ